MSHTCPICRKVIEGALLKESRKGNFYPFCSTRCKLIDLGRWIDGKYRIAPKLKTEDENDKNSGQAESNDE